MRIPNPIQCNDWKINNFLVVVISIQIALFGLILLESIKFKVPIITELLAFIYLTFIPGFLLLRVLRLHNLGNIETTLYSIGLSLGIVMFTGLLMNFIYPVFGISNPISFFNIFTTMAIVVVLLCVLSYLVDKDFSKPAFIEINDILSPFFLFLIIIPFLTIIGSYLFNFYNNNSLKMVLLILIAFLPIIVLKWFPKKYYPMAIFVTSISLLFHTSLVSQYLWGADINFEYYYSNLVIKNSFWNYNINQNLNAMLSITLLAPFYSIYTNMDLTWVFKIIYPFLFSFVPVGLFTAYRKITDSKIALFGCFYFIFIITFFATLPALARQEIAELFFVILIVLMLDEKIKKVKKSFLMILISFSIIVSHYGLSYIFVIIMILALLIYYIYQKRSKLDIEGLNIVNISFILLFIVFCLSWFMYASHSSIFTIGVQVGSHVFESLTDITTGTQASALVTNKISFFQTIEKYFYFISQFFILIGVLTLFSNKYNKIKNQEYKMFSIASIFLLLITFFLPYFASAMNTDRIFHISLIILSPFFVIGFLFFISLMSKIMGLLNSRLRVINKGSFYIIASFLVIFSLFSTGFLYQIYDQPKMVRFALDKNVDFAGTNDMEEMSIKWLVHNKNESYEDYADANKANLLISINGLEKTKLIGKWGFDDKYIYKYGYTFLGTFNVKNHKIFIYNSDSKSLIYYNTTSFESEMNQIYNDGGSIILIGYKEKFYK